MSKMKKAVSAAVLGCATIVGGQAQSADWLMLQGTEPADSSARAKVWGFVQPTYTNSGGGDIPAGGFEGQESQFNSVAPNLESDSQFQLQRARIGVRGTGFPLDNKVNYFVLAEFGKNGITEAKDTAAQLTDASITFNHIPGARVRVGQFKIPMAEEIFQGIPTFNYINFTNFTNQQLLERHLDTDGLTPCHTVNSDAAYLDECSKGNGFDRFGAGRDIGVQVFNTFHASNNWEHSYAAFIGNGNGINEGDNDDNKDLHLYWASTKVFGGKGPRRQDWKTFAWYSDGERTILDSASLNGGTSEEKEYDRTRYGIGTIYNKGKWRFTAEWMKADGMIFNGSTGGAVPGAIHNNGVVVSQLNVLPEEEADGWYVDMGYRFAPKWELDLRYDYLNRATENSRDNNNADEREFETWTIGAQYFLNKKSRIALNYEIRDASAPDNDTADDIVGSIDNRVSLQATVIF